MQIYLLRHGTAGPAPPGRPDSDRTLTAEGRAQVQRVVECAAAELGSPLVVSSPYRRAVETAEIAANVLVVDSGVRSAALTPDRRPEEAWSEINVFSADGRPVLLVGHEPLFSALTAYLLGHPSLDVEFGTANLVSLQVEQVQRRPVGRLRWMLTPSVCR